MQSSVRSRILLVAACTISLLFAAGAAQSATRGMVGSLGVINPSVAPPFFFEVGPTVLGKKVGPYPPTTGWTTVSVEGTTAGTFVGRQVTLPANRMNFSGLQLRDFPAFPNVANLTKLYASAQEAGTFAVDGGALAACPGPGCTSAGSGTAISWCPPLVERPATPAPGTVGNQIGNWDCPSWQAGAGGGDRFLRLGIANAPGANHFGGTLLLLRNTTRNAYFVLVQPGTDGIAEVTRSNGTLMDFAWTPGRPNFQYAANPANAGPRVNAMLGPNGAVIATFGCVNPTGTPGGTFMLGSPIVGLGSNCGTNPAGRTDQQGWGFTLSTATVEGSDPFPFGLVITSAVPPGTPFAPNVGTQPTSLGFFFTRMGGDTVSGTNRNIVLVGGGIAVDPGSGNAFFRIMDLRMDMQVPEPALGAGLVAGAAALTALARRRRS